VKSSTLSFKSFLKSPAPHKLKGFAKQKDDNCALKLGIPISLVAHHSRSRQAGRQLCHSALPVTNERDASLPTKPAYPSSLPPVVVRKNAVCHDDAVFHDDTLVSQESTGCFLESASREIRRDLSEDPIKGVRHRARMGACKGTGRLRCAATVPRCSWAARSGTCWSAQFHKLCTHAGLTLRGILARKQGFTSPE
jgi:hypothetical protein